MNDTAAKLAMGAIMLLAIAIANNHGPRFFVYYTAYVCIMFLTTLGACRVMVINFHSPQAEFIFAESMYGSFAFRVPKPRNSICNMDAA